MVSLIPSIVSNCVGALGAERRGGVDELVGQEQLGRRDVGEGNAWPRPSLPVELDGVAVDAVERRPKIACGRRCGSASVMRASWPGPVGIVLEPGQRPVDAGRADLEPVAVLDRVVLRRAARTGAARSARNRRGRAGACRAARPSPAASGRTCRRSSPRARARSRGSSPRARSARQTAQCRPLDTSVKAQTSLGPEPWGPSLRHLAMSRREPRYRLGKAGSASEAFSGRSAAFSARMRTARTAALSRVKISATLPQPEDQRQDRDLGDHDQIIGVIDEAVGTAPDQRRVGKDDDPRRPARPERREHPDPRELEQHEHRQPEAIDRAARREPPQRGEPRGVDRDDQRIMAGRMFARLWR